MGSEDLGFRPEKDIKGAGKPQEIKDISAAARGVFKVQTLTDNGSGFFLHVPGSAGNPDLWGLVSNEHVLTGDYSSGRSSFNIELNVDSRGRRVPVEVRVESDTFSCTSPMIGGLDLTFIRLDPDLVSPVVRFFDPASIYAREGAGYTIIQHPAARERTVSIATGPIVRVSDDCKSVFYRISTERGSGGSPVLDPNFDVVALHLGQWAGVNEGTSIVAVVTFVQQAFATSPKRGNATWIATEPAPGTRLGGFLYDAKAKVITITAPDSARIHVTADAAGAETLKIGPTCAELGGFEGHPLKKVRLLDLTKAPTGFRAGVGAFARLNIEKIDVPGGAIDAYAFRANFRNAFDEFGARGA
jgi:hypothetical protein